MSKKVVNLCPHPIVLNDGTVHGTSGVIARVSSSYTPFNEEGVCEQTFGDLSGLPEPEEGTTYIVSAMVLSAAKQSGRTDCVAPATGHPDCARDENGRIVSVPGFVI